MIYTPYTFNDRIFGLKRPTLPKRPFNDHKSRFGRKGPFFVKKGHLWLREISFW